MVSPANLNVLYPVFPQNFISGFYTYATEHCAHLSDIKHIRIIFEHDAVCIALAYAALVHSEASSLF